MSTWILVCGVFSHCISLLSADGGSTDGAFANELSMFNADIDPLQSTLTFLPDSTSPDLISDINFNNENSGVFDNMFPNYSDLDLFASSAADSNSVSNSDSNSIIDTTTSTEIAVDCGSFTNNDDILQKNKKARFRFRRETGCSNPYSGSSNPDLSLPTLDQTNNNRKDPLRPSTDREKVIQNSIDDFLLRSGFFLKGANLILAMCQPDEKRVCSSGDVLDVHLEDDGENYSLTSSTASKCSPHLYK